MQVDGVLEAEVALLARADEAVAGGGLGVAPAGAGVVVGVGEGGGEEEKGESEGHCEIERPPSMRRKVG